MADWPDRNVTYPAAPPPDPSEKPGARRAFMDARNLRIGERGAAAAVKNSGVSIGAPKKGKDDK